MKKDNWVLMVFILTFILSIIFSFISSVVTAKFNSLILFVVLILTIFIGILFDVIGTATISANESTFHALNSKKKKGAKESIFLIKNSSKISSFCNDIIGDICGIISGSIGAFLTIAISNFGLNNTLASIFISAFISSITVGGKAIFKKVAIKNADSILIKVGIVLNTFALKKD